MKVQLFGLAGVLLFGTVAAAECWDLFSLGNACDINPCYRNGVCSGIVSDTIDEEVFIAVSGSPGRKKAPKNYLCLQEWTGRDQFQNCGTPKSCEGLVSGDILTGGLCPVSGPE